MAVDEYSRAADIMPNDLSLKLKTAQLLKNSERKDDATKILQELLRQKPEYYEASILLGDILYENEKYKEAINVYLQALNYNPDQYDLYFNLGVLFTELNDFNSAKEYYEKAAQLNSFLYNAKFNLAQIALLYNELDEAQEYFEECVNDENIADEAYYYLAYVSMMKGEKQSAIQYLNTAVEDNIELYEKANKELVFKLIMNKIQKPQNSSKPKKKIGYKEKKVMKHLEETCAIVGDLNHNDIKVIRLLREKEEREAKMTHEKDNEK